LTFGFGRLGFGSADPPNAETAFELEVPKAYAARSFTIWTGFYRGQKRLPAKSANARVDEDRVSGPEISVGECARR
jgi:hypothetical protein